MTAIYIFSAILQASFLPIEWNKVIWKGRYLGAMLLSCDFRKWPPSQNNLITFSTKNSYQHTGATWYKMAAIFHKLAPIPKQAAASQDSKLMPPWNCLSPYKNCDSKLHPSTNSATIIQIFGASIVELCRNSNFMWLNMASLCLASFAAVLAPMS